ncbi:hypothetical protein [Shewanella surugensis]|uniref:Lycopene cyclase domain-containing protein n=1 Tax=Shewanella surugensis TaxID=212020 RepID=A0ABT0LEH6_9GAMM|nr:hypothetical protein [Shewanella surugensis]MCL1125740.1 hypothetical protein [Shewanella surugensis]
MDVFVVVLIGLGLISSGVIYFANKKPWLWLGTFAVSGLLALILIISVFFRELYWLGNIGLVLGLGMSVLMCRHLPNWAYLLMFPTAMKLVDTLWLNDYLLTQVPSWGFYFSYIGYDVLVMALIWYRGPIAKALRLKVHYQRFAQEYLLLGVYGLAVMTNLMTGIEDLVRKDVLGNVFVDFNPIFFYDIYEYIRLPISILEMVLLVGMGYVAVKAGTSKRLTGAGM